MQQLYPIGFQQSRDTWQIKVGVAANPHRRLRQLQTGNSNRLHLLATLQPLNARQTEAALHRKYRHYRRSGEWFELPGAVVEDLLQTARRVA